MTKWFFKPRDLKRDADELHRRVDEEVSNHGYVGELLDEYSAELEELREQINSLPSGEALAIGRRKLAIGIVSLVIIMGAVFLSLEILSSSDSDTVSTESAGNEEYTAGQANQGGNGLQPAIFDSLPTLNMTDTPAIDNAGTRNQAASVKGCEVEPLEWQILDSIEGGRIKGEQTSFYADGYVYYISLENYTLGEVTDEGRVDQWTNISAPSPAHNLGVYCSYAVEYHEATNSVYFAGGQSGFDTAHREVFRCEIQPDHTLGEWVEVNSMVTGRFAPTLRTGEGPNGKHFLYAISGADCNWGFLDTVEFAPINADGSLGEWSITSSLNHPRPGADGFFHDGKLYIFGGGRHSLRNDTVESASVRHDGHLTQWELVGTMGNYRSCPGVAFVPQTNKVYAIGGYTGEYGQDKTDTTEVADISDLDSWNPDGNLKAVTQSLSALTTPESIIVIGRSIGTPTAQYARIVIPEAGTGQYDGL